MRVDERLLLKEFSRMRLAQRSKAGKVMDLAEYSLSREKADLVNAQVLPENCFPSAEDLLSKFRKMKLLELEQFTIKLKYHEVKLSITSRGLRHVGINPVCNQFEDDDSTVDVLCFMGFLVDVATVVRTTGFKAPNYLRELSELDKEHTYMVDWSEYMLYSADYIDLRDFNADEITVCFRLMNEYTNAHKLLVNERAFEELSKSGQITEENKEVYLVKEN